MHRHREGYRELQKQYVENEQRLQQSSYMREYLLYTLFNGGGAEQVHTLAGNLAGENFWNHFHRIVFLEFDREFFGKKALDFQAEILEENMSEEYQYLNLNPQQAVLLLNASPHYMTLQQTAQSCMMPFLKNTVNTVILQFQAKLTIMKKYRRQWICSKL